ncbi:hypothetical protein BDV97DRAFT_320739 [Delphinella strobiligena]|nr:hypothetical protein BDV97DRAFT_320739 [Delphinella strobiligena]
MHFSTIALTSAAVQLAAAAPFSFPLADGFPDLNSTALQAVYKLAGGTLPNGALPTSIKASGVQTLQIIAANELFETAFFTELLSNITSGVAGYEDGNTDYIKDTLAAVIAQEQVHAYGANAILANAKATTIQPCQYDFPVATFDDAIALAQTFTDVVLGVLPLAQTVWAEDAGQETALIQIFGSIIAQEGEQNGFYRFLQKKVASAAPLLTASGPQFAFTAVSQFIVPGSCPNIDVIGINAFPGLAVVTVPTAENSTQLFSVEGTNVTASTASVVYITGQNLPVTVPISNINVYDGKTYFFAPFPYDEGFARGLTIGALVCGTGETFANVTEVAAKTLAGPALIEIN